MKDISTIRRTVATMANQLHKIVMFLCSNIYFKDDKYACGGRYGNLRICGTDIYIYRYGDKCKVCCISRSAALDPAGLPVAVF